MSTDLNPDAVVQVIISMTADYEKRLGARPTHLWLGGMEWDALDEWGKRNATYHMTPTKEQLTDPHMELFGMEVRPAPTRRGIALEVRGENS
jgi:hypothetical protein